MQYLLKVRKFAVEYKEQFHVKLKSRKTKKLSLLCNHKFPIRINFELILKFLESVTIKRFTKRTISMV